MGPKFRAAEQPSQAEFQIFPVSLGRWKVCYMQGKGSYLEPQELPSSPDSVYLALNAFT